MIKHCNFVQLTLPTGSVELKLVSSTKPNSSFPIFPIPFTILSTYALISCLLFSLVSKRCYIWMLLAVMMICVEQDNMVSNNSTIGSDSSLSVKQASKSSQIPSPLSLTIFSSYPNVNIQNRYSREQNIVKG